MFSWPPPSVPLLCLVHIPSLCTYIPSLDSLCAIDLPAVQIEPSDQLHLIPCSLNIISSVGALLLLNVYLLCEYTYLYSLSYLLSALPMKSNKDQLNKFVLYINYLCILEAALVHSSMYYLCLNFHLITTNPHLFMQFSSVQESPAD
jgi:hypothetical protein